MSNMQGTKRNKKETDFLLVTSWFGEQTGGSKNTMLPGIGAETPFSMALLMAYIEQYGFNTELLDLNIESEPLEVLKSTLKYDNPRIVGVSSYSANIVNADKIAKTIKGYKKSILVVLGGFHATAMPEECLTKYRCFDYVMFGECEKSLLVLIKNILDDKPINNIPNLAFREYNKVTLNPLGEIIENLDELPFPLLSKVELKRYKPFATNFFRLPTMGIMTSRGCPFKCTFCATHFQWNKHIRKMSSGLVVDWLEKIIADFGITDFRFYDDTFTIPKSSIVEFCEEVLKRNRKFSWNCYSRVDTIDESLASLMKRAGCYHIKFGIEAGTKKSLKRIKKNITLDRAIQSVKMVKKIGIEAKASFILGIPGETLEDSEKTIDFALKASPDFATFLVMMIYPGSEDYEIWKKQKKIPEDFNWDRPLYANEKDINELKILVKKAYKKFYLRPGFIKDRLKHFIHNPGCEIIRSREALRYLSLKALRLSG